jgi:hypothetical protein
MNRRPLVFAVALTLMIFPQQAMANAGTPLMWAGMFHLAIGNLLIGALEGWLLMWWFSAPRAQTIGVMIGANYFSAWAGGLFLRGAILNSLAIDLNNGWQWFWIMVAVTYGITLLLEFPFIYWLLRAGPNPLKRSVVSSFSVQGVSYLLLFGWYWMAGNTSLYTRANIVKPDALALPGEVTVYFISPSDGAVYRQGLQAAQATKVFDLQSNNHNDRLFVRPNELDTNRWDIRARLEQEDSRNPKTVSVMTNLPLEVAQEWRAQHTNPPEYSSTWFNFGLVPVLGGATNRPWRHWAGFWEAEGLRVSDKTSGIHERFALETPFGMWTVRNAVQLPNDQVIFQLGRDQICAFDPRTRNIALLFHGRGPVPVVEKTALYQRLP